MAAALGMQRKDQTRAFTGLYQFGLLWSLSIVIVLVDLADGVLFLGDIDDRMRALQIRDLLSDGEWYDRSLPTISMPEIYLSPWSRLVDLPYAIISNLFAPFFGLERGLYIASMIWPPILLAGFCALCLFVMRRIGDQQITPVHLGAVALAMTYAIWEFTPGRIDHHNLQLVLIMAMLAGFCLPRRLGGMIAGLSAVLSLMVGLEVLPFIIVAYGVCVLAAVLGMDNARKQLPIAGVTLVFGAPLASIALNGTVTTFATHCDEFSAPWIIAVMLSGFLLIGTGASLFKKARPLFKFGLLFLGSGLLVTVLAMAYPACLAGPYAIIDDVSRSFWFERVPQERSALSFFSNGHHGLILMLGFAGFVLLATFSYALGRARKNDHRFLLVWTLAAAAFTLTVFEIRYLRFLPPFIALMLPSLVMAINGRRSMPRTAFIVFGALAVSLPIAIAYLVMPREIRQFDAVDIMSWDDCSGSDFSVLSNQGIGRVMVPPGLSFPVVEMDSNHSVPAIPFHRSSPGIRRAALAFAGKEANSRREALLPFDYLAVCRREISQDLSDAPLYDALVAGRDWPGLTLIAGDETPGLRLYRIDHAALR